YLVADRVEVISRAAGSGEAWRWFSDGREEFQLEPSEREVRGTSVILHLREEQRDYLDEWRIRELVSRYADYVDHTIELAVQRRPERDASTDSASADSASGETSAADAADDAAVGDETHDAALQTRFETINEGSALWVRGPSEITKEQYHEFYKHLTHDWDEPLAQIHFKIEGTTEFTGILFVPKTRPFDLFDRESHHGIRLYVKRVFIMEDCKEVLPRFLRFMRGMVDSNDLPLNISRELLQDSGLIRVIRKQVVKKALTLIEELASERPDDYATFFENFGPVLKEGVYSEAEHRERLAKLLRFDSSTEEKPTSLADYLTRMKEGQPGIYYALGMSRGMLESSPHLEVLKKKGYEILYLTDHIDQWVSSSLHEFEGKPLVNALAADLKLDENDSEAKAEVEAKTETLRSVIERFKSVLADRVAEVKVSERLDDSPVCLVIPPGGMAAHIERMLRLHKQKLPQTKRILELNPNHGLIKHLQSLLDKDGGTGLLDEWIELLFDQALLTEGSPLENPAAFAGRVTRLMERAAFAEVLRV
ncbi:MAG: molecular chaperone HtpG, partial [Myxococcales bacterium]|nr:molecular chaperone HtpG [Myxococcales bacterium]